MKNNNCELILGDCLEKMKEIEDNSIDLIVTSPPYNAKKNYATYKDDVPLDEWLSLIEKTLKESYRVLSDKSRACFNLTWVMGKKPQIVVPHLIAKIGEELGFYMRPWIMWDKGICNSTAWGSWLSPSGACIRSRCEPILVFQKGIGGKKRISGEGHGKCVKGDCTKEEFLQYTENVWNFKGVRQDVHPAMFPEELPKRLIKLYTWKGDMVLDPFMGVGTTGVVCAKLGRSFVGIELDEKYLKIAEARIKEHNKQTRLFQKCRL